MVKQFGFSLLLCFAVLIGSLQRSLGISNESDVAIQQKADKYIQYTYDKINFGKFRKMNFEVFNKAYYGYLNMIEEGKINSNSLLTVCDFSLSSNLKRMWVIDLKTKKVLYNTLVAHGQGTGEEFAEKFSNTPDSHQSSLGFYTTAETYEGSNGYSLKLHGQDGMFNSNAYDRAIVIHAAEYVCDEYAKANKRIGRSHGCPALPVDIAPKVIDKIKNGQCLFIYYPSKQYLKQSHWITSRLRSLPKEADMMDLKVPVVNNPRYVAIAAEVETPQELSKMAPKIEVCDENQCGDVISEGDKENYKLDVKTIVIKKEDKAKIQDKLDAIHKNK